MNKPTVKCRICWGDKETKLCVTVTTKWSKESIKTIKDILLLCVPWMFVEEDCHLCKPCLWQLKFTYDFIGRCVRTENIINELNNKNNVKLSLEDILERNLRSGNKIQIIFENPISPQSKSVIDLTEDTENTNNQLQKNGDSLGNLSFKSHTFDLPASTEHDYCIRKGAHLNVNITKKQGNDTESVIATQSELYVELLEKKVSEEASTVEHDKENIFDINDDHLDNVDDDFFSDTPTKYNNPKCVSDSSSKGILHDILSNKQRRAVLVKYDISQASYFPPPPKNELTELLDIAPINIRFITAQSGVSAEQQSDLIREGINIVNMSKDTSNKKRTIFLARDLFESYSRCSKCNLTFLSRCDLLDHQHLHRKAKIKRHGEPVHTCKFCSETFTHEIDFRTHTKIHHGIRQPHVCTKCNRKFKILKMLKDHQKTFEAQEKCVYTCKKCHKEFMTEVALTNHEMDVADAPCCNYKKCNVCFKKFTKEDFKIHCEQVHSNYLCPECGKSFVEIVNLYIHRKHVHNPEKLMCHECGKILNHRRSLEHHIQSVHGNKIYMCDKCPRQFTCKAYLQKHSQVHLDAAAVERRKFQCDQCGKVYRKKETLRGHKEMFHLGIKRFICSICNEGFTRKDYLERHIRHHEKYVQNVCQVCGKSFGSSSRLQCHVYAGHDENGKSLQHDVIKNTSLGFKNRKNEYKKGAYPYKCVCKICNRVLASACSLKIHYKAHLRLKDKYKCTACGVILQTQSGLNRHLKLHNDPKFKFSCNICHAYKSSRIELKQHTLKVHKKLKYTCSICFESFGRKHLLSHHVALVHPEETQKKEAILKILEKDRIFVPKDSDTERGSKSKKVNEIDINTLYNQLVKDNDLNNVQSNACQKSSALESYKHFSEDRAPVYVSANKKIIVSEIDYQISEETRAYGVLEEENCIDNFHINYSE